MKKFILSLTMALAVLTASANDSGGGNFNVFSLLNSSVSALVVSNGVGATNLTFIAQVGYLGKYQLTTNTLGTSITANIATNTLVGGASFYSNSTPVTWYGQQFIGSLVTLTNSTTPITSTNDIIYQTVTTNNAINFFVDAPLQQNFFNTMGEYGIGAASTTNSIGYLEIVTSPWSLYGYAAGAGSNQINFVFEPVSAAPQTYSQNPIAGWTPGMSTAFNTDLWTVTFTNQISTVGNPTVFRTPVPRWKFPGAKALRLRGVYTADSTNAVCINSITLQTWVP